MNISSTQTFMSEDKFLLQDKLQAVNSKWEVSIIKTQGLETQRIDIMIILPFGCIV